MITIEYTKTGIDIDNDASEILEGDCGALAVRKTTNGIYVYITRRCE